MTRRLSTNLRFSFLFFFILKLYDTERSGNLCQMKLPTRVTSVETGSKLEVLSRLLYHTFFLIGGISLYRVRFKTLKKQRSSYSVHLLRRKSLLYTLYKRYLILRWNPEFCRLRRKRDRDSFIFFFFIILSSFFVFRLITPLLFVHLVSYSIPADGDTNDMSLTTSPPPVLSPVPARVPLFRIYALSTL